MRTSDKAPGNRAVPESLLAMGKLVSPFGLVSRLTWLPVTEGEPDFPIFSGSLGNPGAVLSAQAEWAHDPSSGNFDGAGGALDRETAAHLAAAESLERYSSCAWDPSDMIWATAAELGDDAVPPWEWPNCSPTELADPRCGLAPADPRVPLRWLEGWSFARNRKVYVPAVQVYLKCSPESASERYLHPVSTGCATHSDPLAAVTNGLLEVVERDSIALTWLQRLRLPRLDFSPDQLLSEHREYAERASSETPRRIWGSRSSTGSNWPTTTGPWPSWWSPPATSIRAGRSRSCTGRPPRCASRSARSRAGGLLRKPPRTR